MVKTEDLKRIRLLADMPEDLLEIIAAKAQVSIFNTNSVLFDKDEDIDTFYLVLMGQVALKVEILPDVDVIIDTLQAGSSFGSSSLTPDAKASYTAVCQEPCELISLSGDTMKPLFKENSKLGFQLMLRLAGQYKANMESRKQMIMKTLDDYPEFKEKIHDLDNLTPAF